MKWFFRRGGRREKLDAVRPGSVSCDAMSDSSLIVSLTPTLRFAGGESDGTWVSAPLYSAESLDTGNGTMLILSS